MQILAQKIAVTGEIFGQTSNELSYKQRVLRKDVLNNENKNLQLSTS